MLDDTLATCLRLGVDRDLDDPVPDADRASSDRHGHALADQAPRHE